jgi:hypothetical protein
MIINFHIQKLNEKTKNLTLKDFIAMAMIEAAED